LCVDKVAAMEEFNPNFELSLTLSDIELTNLSEMINVKSFHWHDNEETTKFDKEFKRALVIAEAMQSRVSRHSVLLDGVQHYRVYNDFKKLWKSSEESADDDSSYSSSGPRKKENIHKYLMNS